MKLSKLSKRSASCLSALVVGALLAGVGATNVASAGTSRSEEHWTGAWSTAVQPPTDDDANWSSEGFDDQTVRQVLRVSTGGSQLRVRLSNAYGESPVVLAGATIAKTAKGAAIRPGTTQRLTFDAARSTELPADGDVRSDPVSLATKPLEKLTVSLYFAEPTGSTTFHAAAIATSYRADGDHSGDESAMAFGETTPSSYFLSGVDVAGAVPGERDTVVTVGDSITDGVGGSADADHRYPDELAERLVDAGKPMGVLNAGISGNRVLNDSTCYGERVTERLERDVFDQTGVSTIIVMEGINDIGFSEIDDNPCYDPNPQVTARQLIAGHQAVIDAAHGRDLKVIGGTLTPYKGASYRSERGERVRTVVNTWIRTSGAYDAVVDFDRALADPADPEAMLPKYDSGDHLHPGDAGFRAMAEAVDLVEL